MPTTAIVDDFKLLDLMMSDLQKAPDLYKPNKKWSYYEIKLLHELKSLGLEDFRRRKNSILTRFGATDLLPKSGCQNGVLLKTIQFFLNIKKIEKLCEITAKVLYDVNFKNLMLLYYELSKLYGQINGAKPIYELETSLVGNPEDVFSVDGKFYTYSFAKYSAKRNKS
ncbi:MAG: hypothetical protein QXE05_09895 [Nitrososphaeria archaeon]